jgi:hypothetical protein
MDTDIGEANLICLPVLLYFGCTMEGNQWSIKLLRGVL